MEQDPQPLAIELERLMKHLGAPPRSVIESLNAEWDAIVSPELAGRCRPTLLRDGRLVVEVPDSATASRLRWEQARITDWLRETHGEQLRNLDIKIRAR